jgi:hypothetical protein
MARRDYFEVLPRHPSDSWEAILAADRLRDGTNLMTKGLIWCEDASLESRRHEAISKGEGDGQVAVPFG